MHVSANCKHFLRAKVADHTHMMHLATLHPFIPIIQFATSLSSSHAYPFDCQYGGGFLH
jgi:hypothetical protein